MATVTTDTLDSADDTRPQAQAKVTTEILGIIITGSKATCCRLDMPLSSG
jgi:hypothetical protein